MSRLEHCPRCGRKQLHVISTTATDIVVGWHVDTYYACRCGWRGSVVHTQPQRHSDDVNHP